MIPIFTLERQNKNIGKEIESAIKEVIERGIFVMGPKVADFEKEFAEYIGTKYAVAVASGTDALTLSLLSLGISCGDEVIIPVNSYPTAFAVAATGAVPKLVDIDPFTYTIDTEKLARAIGKKTKAIIPVHLYGGIADIEKIMEIAAKHRVPVIEDCAQAAGATLNCFYSEFPKSLKLPRSLNKKKIWKKVGSIGHLGCFSFYPTKNLGCFGDGGMVVTNDKKLAEKVRLLRMYGERGRYNSVTLGRNSRLDELQAAILLVKLKYLDVWNEKRKVIAGKYTSGLSNLGRLGLPTVETGYFGHVYHLFVIRAKRRDELKEYLLRKGIQTAVHYPFPVHLVPSFVYLGYKRGDFPESERVTAEILSLPMFPELTDKEIERVVEEIKNFYKEKKC